MYLTSRIGRGANEQARADQVVDADRRLTGRFRMFSRTELRVVAENRNDVSAAERLDRFRFVVTEQLRSDDADARIALRDVQRAFERAMIDDDVVIKNPYKFGAGALDRVMDSNVVAPGVSEIAAALDKDELRRWPVRSAPQPATKMNRTRAIGQRPSLASAESNRRSSRCQGRRRAPGQGQIAECSQCIPRCLRIRSSSERGRPRRSRPASPP